MDLITVLAIFVAGCVAGHLHGERHGRAKEAHAFREGLATEAIRQSAVRAELKQLASSPLGRLALAQDTGDGQ